MSFIDALSPFFRYLMLAIALFVTVRLIVALFCKKVTDPVRGKLINNITQEAIPLYDRETSLGRNKKCDVVLSFDTISRLHAVIAYRSKGLDIFDTFSKSGVAVNNQKIEGKSHLKNGDVINMGGLEFTLEESKYKYIKDKSGVFGKPSYGVILILLAVFNVVSLLLNIQPDGEYNIQVVLTYIIFIAMQWLYYVFASFVLKIYNFELEMIGFMLTSIGLAIIGSMYPGAVLKQFLAVVLGLVGYCVLLIILRFVSTVKVIRYILAAGAIGILAVTLVIAEPTNGALSWLTIGGFSIQPSEFVKIAFIFVGAATLEKLQSIKHLTMYIIFAAICVGELFMMYDFGTALIFFFAFIVIAFMRSGDTRTIMLICMVAALGAALILIFRPYVANRFATYLHVWEYMDEGGYQQTRTLIYSVSGGLFGLGLGNGELRNIFAAAEDLVFGVVCEEFGMIMGFLIPVVYICVVIFAVINAPKAKSAFYSIAGIAASSMMLFQGMLSIFGITDILPLTGVTLPFVSKGGSSIISCFCLLAFIKAIDTRTYASFKPQLMARSNSEMQREVKSQIKPKSDIQIKKASKPQVNQQPKIEGKPQPQRRKTK